MPEKKRVEVNAIKAHQLSCNSTAYTTQRQQRNWSISAMHKLSNESISETGTFLLLLFTEKTPEVISQSSSSTAVPKGKGKHKRKLKSAALLTASPLLWGRKQCLVQDLPHQCTPQPQDLPPPLSLPANWVPSSAATEVRKRGKKKTSCIVPLSILPFSCLTTDFLISLLPDQAQGLCIARFLPGLTEHHKKKSIPSCCAQTSPQFRWVRRKQGLRSGRGMRRQKQNSRVGRLTWETAAKTLTM